MVEILLKYITDFKTKCEFISITLTILPPQLLPVRLQMYHTHSPKLQLPLVFTLIDNGKLANQIARLKAIVVKMNNNLRFERMCPSLLPFTEKVANYSERGHQSSDVSPY